MVVILLSFLCQKVPSTRRCIETVNLDLVVTSSTLSESTQHQKVH